MQEKIKSFKNHLFNEKIHTHHYDRLAIIYIRQSTLQQLEKNSESTRLQYNLVSKAKELGWSADQILVIDEDLGHSGGSAEGRFGFQRLVAEVSLNHVGIILGIEISRLARSCKDWYHLLEVCSLCKTLISDIDGIYDPCSYNDRLLLGLKGTMSEAELHIMTQRMLQTRKSKAHRGELRIPLPMGYAKDKAGKTIKDPDEQAQITINMVFELFDKYSTINSVLKYLVRHKIELPYRETSVMQKGDLIWRQPNRTTLGNLLHNPTYAGAYVYGRKQTVSPRKEPNKISIEMPYYEVLIKDKIPAYITWEQYERNQRQLFSNSIHGIGVPRSGESLLAGLLICGRCGLRMTTYYTNNRNKLRYICDRSYSSYGKNICQSLVGKGLDELITKQILEAIKPSALEVSLQIATDIELEYQNLHNHWKKRLERVQYEVDRAARQYNASEPENRLVTRTLETKWEESLSREKKLNKEYADFLADQSKILSATDREAIKKLASDIPNLWSSATTTIEEKQEITRLLIERVIVRIEGVSEKVSVEIDWYGGHKTTANFVRSIGALEQLSYYDELMTLVKISKERGLNAREIADILNRRGWLPPKLAKSFNKELVHKLIIRCGKNKVRKSVLVDRIENELTFYELAQKTKIAESTLYSWMKKGELKIRKANLSSKSSIWLITADEKEIKRLISLKNRPRQWIFRSKVKRVD